jgi:hypothetical protein
MRWKPIFPSEQSDDPIMERLPIIDSRLLGIYLHRFKASKERPIIGGHDHPWDFAFLVLSGGYEEIPCRCMRVPRKKWDFGVRLASTIHSIRVNESGCLTLCIRGPARRKWGWRPLR